MEIKKKQEETYVRFSELKEKWPNDVLHDKIELQCDVQGADFAVKSTFEVLFYDFKYEAANQLPEKEKCFHVASKLPKNPPSLPELDSALSKTSYWYSNGSILLQCCLYNKEAVYTIGGVLLLPNETYVLPNDSNGNVTC